MLDRINALEWNEVNEYLNLNTKAVDIFNTLDRINAKGDLWKDITKEKANLKPALNTIKNSG